MDTTGPFAPSGGGTKYDVHIVDDVTPYAIVKHVKDKSGVSTAVEEVLLDLKSNNIKPKYMRCDMAGEHVALKALCQKYSIEIEFTTHKTPQRNKAECSIRDTNNATFCCLTQCNLAPGLKKKLRAEAKTDVVYIKNLLVYKQGERPLYEQFFGKAVSHGPKY